MATRSAVASTFQNSCKYAEKCGLNDVIRRISHLTVTRNFHSSVIHQGGQPKSHWRQNRAPALTKLRNDKRQKVTERKAYGGHKKLKALKINKGLYQWKSQDMEYVTPILRVVHSTASKHFARQGIMVKGAVIEVDGRKFKEWFSECQEGQGQDTGSEQKDTATLDPTVLQQLLTGKLYAKITSRPGQEGVCNGYILEGDELNELFSNPQMKLQKAQHVQSTGTGESAT